MMKCGAKRCDNCQYCRDIDGKATCVADRIAEQVDCRCGKLCAGCDACGVSGNCLRKNCPPTDPPSPPADPCTVKCETIWNCDESGDGCVTYEKCNDLPPECEACDCSCNQDCPACYKCNESTGKCEKACASCPPGQSRACWRCIGYKAWFGAIQDRACGSNHYEEIKYREDLGGNTRFMCYTPICGKGTTCAAMWGGTEIDWNGTEGRCGCCRNGLPETSAPVNLEQL